MFPTSTFIPQMKGQLKSPNGYTATGDATYGKPRQVGVSVVRLETMVRPTSIRTDKSGSQGRSDEMVLDGRLLLDNGSSPKGGDLIEVRGITYEIVDVYPRYDMDGLINHFQVDVKRWD